jgi:cellulose biosynthesis protein BcsQ
MKVVTFFNNKGGVGKTTLLCNIASYLGKELGKKVLVIDADPQCNATIYLLPELIVDEVYKTRIHETIQSFIDPLKKGKGYAAVGFEPISSPRFGVDLVPGDPSLALSEDLLAADWKSGVSGDPRGLQTTYIFEDLFQRFTSYDYVFVDVSPSLGAINRSVLLASDYFLMPLSSDIFSLMAVKNISLALAKWRKDVGKALAEYQEEEGEPFKLGSKTVKWKLKFCGYVAQQYTAKTIRGIREPVKAYDKIIKKISPAIQREIISKLNSPRDVDYKLGSIPNLNSIIPLSQNANAPIFDLGGADGVVGAHFDKVKEAKALMARLAAALVKNIKEI